MSVDSMAHLQDCILENFWDKSYDKGEEILSRLERPACLYHYTSRDAAVAILDKVLKSPKRSGCGFAFTDCRFLNDDREFKLGLEVAAVWLKNYDRELPDVQGELRELVLRDLSDAKMASKLMPYVLSFSEDKDSTTHWATYTDRNSGGYSIGLKYDKVEKEVRAYNKKLREDGETEKTMPMVFAPCIYCSADELNRMSANKKLSKELRDVLGRSMAGISNVLYSKDKEVCARWIAKRIFQFACLVKSGEFRFENEWRLVLRRNGQEDEEVEIIGSKPRITPKFLRLGSCINNVIVSPHGDTKRLKLLGKFQAERLGRRCPVKDSKSAYNGR